GKYSFLCDPEGGVIDDIVIYSFADFIRLVVNAGTRIQVLAWLEDHKQSDDVEIEDLTSSVSMIAIQGPRAESILQRLVEIPLGDLPYYWARAGEIAGDMGMISRTGYTGEDGFELYVQTDKCERTWGLLSDVGARAGLVPSGLGARDTLRLEAGMPLYGHELSRDLNPIQAGLHRFVDLEKEFIGRDALLLAKENKEIRRLVGLAVEGRRIPRQGADVYRDNRKMGVVTSGTHSPTLQKTIALAYLEGDAPIDSLCEVDIRGKRHGAKVTAIPFYKREK
ncbi:MAG: glycine cleavage system aminomethyltransferase GcvT, partial [Planctomycetota bacterium]|nr:glycine cleavage system aminomethyltransferase GcvT [Planctomycetota bacterium]